MSEFVFEANMADHRIHATHLLRLFVWKLLEGNGLLSTMTVHVNGRAGQAIPVAPLSDEPLFADVEPRKTYLIYGYVENDVTFGPHRTGTISFRIIAPTFNELTQVINTMTAVFELEDQAAAAINRWTSQNEDYIGTRFTSVCTSFLEVGDPEVKEGGPVEGVINLRYRYVRENPPVRLPDEVESRRFLRENEFDYIAPPN